MSAAKITLKDLKKANRPVREKFLLGGSFATEVDSYSGEEAHSVRTNWFWEDIGFRVRLVIKRG
jgi:hypothetical protein